MRPSDGHASANGESLHTTWELDIQASVSARLTYAIQAPHCQGELKVHRTKPDIHALNNDFKDRSYNRRSPT